LGAPLFVVANGGEYASTEAHKARRRGDAIVSIHRFVFRQFRDGSDIHSSICPACIGGVNGTVTDPTGSVVVGATATLTNQDTNVVSHAVTSGRGYFVFLDIKPGPYVLTITKQGFKTVELPVFQLVMNQKAGVDYIYQNRLQRNLYQHFTFSDSITSNIGAANTGNSLAPRCLDCLRRLQHNSQVAEDYFSMAL
jgi:hypothetical protein